MKKFLLVSYYLMFFGYEACIADSQEVSNEVCEEILQSGWFYDLDNGPNKKTAFCLKELKLNSLKPCRTSEGKFEKWKFTKNGNTWNIVSHLATVEDLSKIHNSSICGNSKIEGNTRVRSSYLSSTVSNGNVDFADSKVFGSLVLKPGIGNITIYNSVVHGSLEIEGPAYLFLVDVRGRLLIKTPNRKKYKINQFTGVTFDLDAEQLSVIQGNSVDIINSVLNGIYNVKSIFINVNEVLAHGFVQAGSGWIESFGGQASFWEHPINMNVPDGVNSLGFFTSDSLILAPLSISSGLILASSTIDDSFSSYSACGNVRLGFVQLKGTNYFAGNFELNFSSLKEVSGLNIASGCNTVRLNVLSAFNGLTVNTQADITVNGTIGSNITLIQGPIHLQDVTITSGTTIEGPVITANCTLSGNIPPGYSCSNP